MFGLGAIFDVVTAPFAGIDNLLEGDFEGFFMDPLEELFSAEIFFGFSLGDMASFIDGILDQYPWLKTAIVAAGFAMGGVGGLVAAAAIAATDFAAKGADGELTFKDLSGSAMEFGALYAAGAAGAGAGMFAGSTLAQAQMGAEILTASGLLGEDVSRYLAVGTAAATANWNSIANSARNIATALKDTGLLPEKGNAVMNALLSASSGDYSSLQKGIQSGADALMHVTGDEGDKWLGAVSTAAGGDYASFDTVIDTALSSASFVTDDGTDKWLGAISSAVDGDYSDVGGIFGTVADAAGMVTDGGTASWLATVASAADADYSDIGSAGRSVLGAVQTVTPGLGWTEAIGAAIDGRYHTASGAIETVLGVGSAVSGTDLAGFGDAASALVDAGHGTRGGTLDTILDIAAAVGGGGVRDVIGVVDAVRGGDYGTFDGILETAQDVAGQVLGDRAGELVGALRTGTAADWSDPEAAIEVALDTARTLAGGSLGEVEHGIDAAGTVIETLEDAGVIRTGSERWLDRIDGGATVSRGTLRDDDALRTLAGLA